MRDIPPGAIGFRLAHELEGLLQGIRADGAIEPLEQDRLASWLEWNKPHAHLRPFSELALHVQRALADGHLSVEECDDMLFVVGKFTTVNPYFDSFRAGVQVLMGMLAGVNADGVLEEREVRALSDWAEDWSHLAGLWPYDECRAIVSSMIANHRIAEEAEVLRGLAAQFPIGSVDGDAPPPLIGGICASDPDIQFRAKCFVFTGESERAGRDELCQLVSSLGGIATANVTRKSDYLVVCDQGCQHWAFSCYGRKVEKAYNMRREGHSVLIVHETDFWDALAGHSASL